MNETYTHEFHESGNGFPSLGDDVICDCGSSIKLLKIVSTSCIQTAQFRANMFYVECAASDTDWDDLSESEQDRLYANMHHVVPVSEEETQ